MDFLTLQAKLRAQHIAVTDLTYSQQWTYQQLDCVVSQIAAWLLDAGIQQGSRVAVLSKNRAEVVMLHLACARYGAIFVPLNWRLADNELQVLLDDCEPAILFTDDPARQFTENCRPIDELLSACSSMAATELTADSSLPSLLLYTSGTTGKPKGVMHTERSLMESTLNASLVCQVDAGSVFLCEAPMFHVIGLITCVRPALYQGGQLMITDGFQPQRTLACLMDSKLSITHYFCVPQMANALRQEPEFSPSKLKGLKALLTGGAPHPEVQIRAWLKDGIPIVDGYGMSEAGTVFGMPFDLHTIDRKAGSVGVHSHRIQVRLADDADNPVEPGLAGEVQLKGANLTTGFWRNAEAYRECFTEDGWFRTGDIATADEEGFYRIVDRKKDMFISGGENVYPAEVEEMVLQQPRVRECAMVGIADPRWGEVGCLFVALADRENVAADTILKPLERQLAKYKLPKKIFFIEALPRNGSGKVLKNELKRLAANVH